MKDVAQPWTPAGRPGWLVPVRAAWLVVTGMLLVLWLLGTPALFHMLRTPCVGAACEGYIGPSFDQYDALIAAGIAPALYAAANVALFQLSLLVWLGVGFLIFLRRGYQLGMLVMSFAIATNTLMVSAPVLAVVVFGSALTPLVGLFAYLADLAFFTIFFLFPDGHFVPAWARWAFALAALEAVPRALLPADSPVNSGPGGTIHQVITSGLYLTAIGAQVYRYRRVATARQRAQSKWAVVGLVIAFTGQASVLTYAGLRPSDATVAVVASSLVPLAQLAIPLSIGVAILRSRLYDIDVIINRTLVYGSLTVLLAGIYVGSVVLLQALAHVFTAARGESPVVIVVSTLLIAALFQPLRAALQRTIDRRFYRTKYDAAKALAGFAATLRGEIDIRDLERHLIDVAEDTMQPASAWLWLRSQQSPAGAWRKPSTNEHTDASS